MALVVFLRGINVGGYRRFRPSTLADDLQYLDLVNIGAAGTFVVRHPVNRTVLREEIASRLPFGSEIMICEGREILELSSHPFRAVSASQAKIVRFVSILSRVPRVAPRLPIHVPSTGRWLLQVVARKGRFVLGVYKRDMKVIRYLGKVERLFGVPTTTRNWMTVTKIVKALST